MTRHFAFEGNEPSLSFHRRSLLASAGIAAFAGSPKGLFRVNNAPKGNRDGSSAIG